MHDASLPYLDDAFLIPWSRLKPDTIIPSIEEALRRAQARIDQVAAAEPSTATYESAFLGLEHATEELNRAWGVVSHLSSVEDSPALREAHNAMLPKVSEFFARIPLNAALWTVLKAAADKPATVALTGVRRRHVDETVAEFRQHGADLPPEKKARLEQVQAELAAITQKYSENTLDATNAWELIVHDEAQLVGLPASAKEAARRNALGKGHGTESRPAWRFTLHQPSYEPFMTYLESDELRRRMWEGSIAVGAKEPHDNTPIIRRILELRREKAALLGRTHFADLVLERRMAHDGATALRFVEDMHRRIRGAFTRECADLEAFKAQATGAAPGPLQPWELMFWAEKLRRERYAFDEEELRPYFALDRVVDGMFRIAEKLFGVVIRPHAGGAETWHPDVKVYDLFDGDGIRHLGTFYADWHPRESKRSGAWMNFLITGGPQPDGRRLPHLGLICGNLTPPVGDAPALLKHREVETVFHEFGHLIHHLFGEVEIKSLNGVNVAWDFVELPSQIMENWCWERESLDVFARHHQTGAAIPEELFARMRAARNFRSAAAAMRQLAFCRVDLAMHMEPARFLAAADLEAEVQVLLRDYNVPLATLSPSIIRRFGHLFADPVGYAAGYYSYKWAEVLDADAFTRFQREGIFNGNTGRAFREHILSRGNSEDPMVLYRRFVGRDPDPEALLVRSGLAVARSS
ncbi:MAG: M3 family metallopeptidase [Opitutaceae bacterium]|nr:M3 family metallopeptidase [Opitutaceae bacterium]